jgi:Na+-transporting NADH:ubiquinone oxidoreductase subunit NqrF
MSDLPPPDKRPTIDATSYVRTLNPGDVVVIGGARIEVLSVQTKRRRVGLLFRLADGHELRVERRSDRSPE